MKRFIVNGFCFTLIVFAGFVTGQVYRKIPWWWDSKGYPRCWTATCAYWRAEYFLLRDYPIQFRAAGEAEPLRFPVHDLAYPQYEHQFRIPASTWKDLRDYCSLKLQKETGAHPDVIEHWKRIARGEPPFGLKVQENGGLR